DAPRKPPKPSSIVPRPASYRNQEIRRRMSLAESDTDALTHTLGPGDLVRDLKIRGRLGSGPSGSASPFLATPSHNRGESRCRATCDPRFTSGSVFLKDAWFVTASHLPVPQCQGVRRADSHGNPVASVGPSLRRGIFKPPKPLATARVRAAQHSRVASAPRRITVP